MGTRNLIRNKKGQEEMVGFVLIVIIVAVMFLVFIGFYIRQDRDVGDRDSREISQFLEAMDRYTSECAIRFEPDFSTIGELVQECYNGRLCLNGKNACEVLGKDVKEILEGSWHVGNESYYKGYEFSAYYESSNSGIEESEDEGIENIIEMSDGVCSGRYIGAEISSAESGLTGTFVKFLKICF